MSVIKGSLDGWLLVALSLMSKPVQIAVARNHTALSALDYEHGTRLVNLLNGAALGCLHAALRLVEQGGQDSSRELVIEVFESETVSTAVWEEQDRAQPRKARERRFEEPQPAKREQWRACSRDRGVRDRVRRST
ncbi:hypothetical protein Micbo1qcDRAFT_177349 [Microdochium bolleyi]|uniref:Uncharacterized protein n=1 Tax=Microdochium bolleyi TaxID=196109 RepID=A0A136IXA1_9PEZI|nr:hypothetical protein Micbo1qcDRAFT_177349 [Microdochium bolleyi]